MFRPPNRWKEITAGHRIVLVRGNFGGGGAAVQSNVVMPSCTPFVRCTRAHVPALKPMPGLLRGPCRCAPTFVRWAGRAERPGLVGSRISRTGSARRSPHAACAVRQEPPTPPTPPQKRWSCLNPGLLDTHDQPSYPGRYRAPSLYLLQRSFFYEWVRPDPSG